MVKVSLTPATEAIVQAIGSFGPSAPDRRPLPRKHKLMLLIAFEVLVLGFALAEFFPVRSTGIVIEMSVTPNHVVT